jgi:transcriptional regulator with XRE-family HTH domain
MSICIPYPVIDMVKTGENIRKLREDKNLKVIEVQIFLGLSSPQAIYQWERGVSLPTVDHLCALSHLFEMSMNEILALRDEGHNNRADTVHTSKKTVTMAKKMMLLIAA